MKRSTPSPEWSNTGNTPSPVFFPSASPTPKLSSTPSKKPPSPVDWHQELVYDGNSISTAAKHPTLYSAPFTFDGDLTRPELDVLLEKLQQSTLSADTMASSFLGDLDDDIQPDDDFFLTAGIILSGIDTVQQMKQQQQQQQQEHQQQQQQQHDHRHDGQVTPGQEQSSDSQQLRQWLEQLPETIYKQEEKYPVGKVASSSASATSSASSASLALKRAASIKASTLQEMKRASFIKIGKQWMAKMKKAASNSSNGDNNTNNGETNS